MNNDNNLKFQGQDFLAEEEMDLITDEDFIKGIAEVHGEVVRLETECNFSYEKGYCDCCQIEVEDEEALLKEFGY